MKIYKFLKKSNNPIDRRFNNFIPDTFYHGYNGWIVQIASAKTPETN